MVVVIGDEMDVAADLGVCLGAGKLVERGDLAGGGPGENELETFFRIAADNSATVLLAFLAAWK